MPHPTGLLMTAAAVTPELVSRALNEQGGPEWDETVFQMLTGVDLRGLTLGKPAAGKGSPGTIGCHDICVGDGP